MRRNECVMVRTVILLGSMIGFLLLGLPVDAGAEELARARPDLTGVVKDAEDKPLPGATVFIYTAGPKEGAGILCPSCYADCRKRATTDAQGHFKIESLDPALLFRILVVGRGMEPKFVGKVDPASEPIEVTLKAAREAVSPGQQVKGHIVDADGHPVPGAVINIRGVTRDRSTRFGGNDDIDQVAVTDDAGFFVINGKTNFDSLGIDVEARGLAKAVFHHLKTGGEVHELKLTEGASVKGRLLKDGQPLAGVVIGVSGADRNSESYVGDFNVGTDQEGKFLLVNLPPNTAYYLYAKMDSLGAKGAVPAKDLRLDGDGSVTDAGDLNVIPGFTLKGKIRLSDGKPAPPKTRVLLSRDQAWDSLQTMADAQGNFSFAGLPPETITLFARIKGYHLSPHNKSLDLLNPSELVGILRTNKTDLILEFDPGPERREQAGYTDIRQEPLRGAEATTSHSGDIHVTGTVIDAETKQPLRMFTVIEGRAGMMPDTIQWFDTRQTEGTNGQFDIFLNQGQGRNAPAIAVTAEGYLPEASGLINGTETNLNFALKKGTGPHGVVSKPDGKPAGDATVYLVNLQDGVYVSDANMKVSNRVYRGTRSTKADADGKFSFVAHVGDFAIMVLENDGFAQVRVDDLSRQPEVRLQPWGKVEGKLMIGSRAGTNETIHLGLASVPYEFSPRQFAPLNLFLQTETDNEGRFAFERVPPINIQVYHSPQVREATVGVIPQSQMTNFTVKPGEVKTMTLGGKGRPVIGKFVVKGYDGRIDWRADVQSLERVLPPIDEASDMVKTMQEFSGKIQAADSDAEKQRLRDEMNKARETETAKLRAFYATEKGREYAFQNGRYALNFAQDGSFRIEDVPGGKYRLHVELREASGSEVMRFNVPMIASYNKEIEVPESPGGRTDEPFDLGTMELNAKQTLKVGKKVPNFEVKTVDGQTVTLAQFSGKYLLLDFWAVWCGPCIAETPHLKETYAAFKDDPRFRMLGLSLDPNIEAPRDYARKKELGWPIGFLGEWSKTDLPNQYGVDGIPAIFLIGPDGKVIAQNLRGDNIKAAVQKALSGAQSSKTN